MSLFETYLDFSFHWMSRHVSLFDDRLHIMLLLRKTTFQNFCEVSEPEFKPYCIHGYSEKLHGKPCDLCQYEREHPGEAEEIPPLPPIEVDETDDRIRMSIPAIYLQVGDLIMLTSGYRSVVALETSKTSDYVTAVFSRDPRVFSVYLRAEQVTCLRMAVPHG